MQPVWHSGHVKETGKTDETDEEKARHGDFDQTGWMEDEDHLRPRKWDCSKPRKSIGQ